MQLSTDITTVVHVIQLAVAPVFLLTGVGAILSVLVNRLGRVVDRFRALEMGVATSRAIDVEMDSLEWRARLIHRAISLCTSGALLICIVIAALFIGAFFAIDVSAFIVLLFVLAMLALILGLLLFLREIYLATGSIHVKPR